ncbi:MAG: asparagine synthase-related protein, partial [Calditrichaeota bacterium]|nr:asparagine synthase-related protein [Calditrichota bacterium]
EFAATVPPKMKMRGSHVKWILKRAMKHRLPKEIIDRKKVGFPTPLSLMFKNDLSDYVSDLLLSAPALNRGYFERISVEKLIREHRAGKSDHHRVLWQLIVLEEWHRAFLGRATKRQAPALLPV